MEAQPILPIKKHYQISYDVTEPEDSQRRALREQILDDGGYKVLESCYLIVSPLTSLELYHKYNTIYKNGHLFVSEINENNTCGLKGTLNSAQKLHLVYSLNQIAKMMKENDELV